MSSGRLWSCHYDIITGFLLCHDPVNNIGKILDWINNKGGFQVRTWNETAFLPSSGFSRRDNTYRYLWFSCPSEIRSSCSQPGQRRRGSRSSLQPFRDIFSTGLASSQQAWQRPGEPWCPASFLNIFSRKSKYFLSILYQIFSERDFWRINQL